MLGVSSSLLRERAIFDAYVKESLDTVFHFHQIKDTDVEKSISFVRRVASCFEDAFMRNNTSFFLRQQARKGDSDFVDRVQRKDEWMVQAKVNLTFCV